LHGVEIRVLDVQECPRADLAIAAAASNAVRLCGRSAHQARALATARLATCRAHDRAGCVGRDADYLRARSRLLRLARAHQRDAPGPAGAEHRDARGAARAGLLARRILDRV
jgi:hypothetical protein